VSLTVPEILPPRTSVKLIFDVVVETETGTGVPAVTAQP
jgi:hypothetical protein